MTWVCIYSLGFHVSSGLRKKVINCLDSRLQRNAWIRKHDSSSLQFMRFCPSRDQYCLVGWTLRYLWVLDGRKTNQTPANNSGSSFLFLFFTQPGEERAVLVQMCPSVQLLNVSCSIEILNLDDIQEPWNEGIFPQRTCRRYTCTFLAQTKRHQLSIRHLQFLKESIKSKPFENKCVCEAVRARLQQLWPDSLLAGFIAYRQTARPQQSQLTALICFDRGGLSTALDTHLQQEPRREKARASFRRKDKCTCFCRF